MQLGSRSLVWTTSTAEVREARFPLKEARDPSLFGANSRLQPPVGLRPVQAHGESFTFEIGTEQQSVRWPQPTPANQAPVPAPAPVGPFSVLPSASAQPAAVSAPAPGPTQPRSSHDSRFDQEQVIDADNHEGALRHRGAPGARLRRCGAPRVHSVLSSGASRIPRLADS